MQLLGIGQARVFALALATLGIFILTAPASADVYEEGFESFDASGWTAVDRSTAAQTPWSAGLHDDSGWSAHSGSDDSFVNSSIYSDEGHVAQSDWLISPKFTNLSNGDVISFWMRAKLVIHRLLYTSESFQLRVSSNGSCSPGDSADSTGDFDTLLFDVDTGGYREVWSGPPPYSSVPQWRELGATIQGLPAGESSGCIAIRHATPDQWGASPLVAVDDFRLADGDQSDGAAELLAPLPPATGGDTMLLIRGRAYQGSTVRIYTDDQCAGTTIETSAASFLWPGVFVGARTAGHTRVWATVELADHTLLPCRSLGVDYLLQNPDEGDPDDGPTLPTGPTASGDGAGAVEVKAGRALLSRRALRGRAGAVRARLACVGQVGAAACKGDIAFRLRGVSVRARYRVVAGSSAQVLLRLGASARRKLRQMPRRSTTVRVHLRQDGSGDPQVLRRKLILIP